MSLRKAIYSLFIFTIMTFSISASAKTLYEDLFQINISNGLNQENSDLSYIMTLSENESYYVGFVSQKLIEDRVIEGKLKNMESINFSIVGRYSSSKYDRPLTGKARLTLIDTSKASVVWQGEFEFDTISQKLNVTTLLENKKYLAIPKPLLGARMPTMSIHPEYTSLN